jgi:hypothetical protein
MRRLPEAWELYREPKEQRLPDKLAAIHDVSRRDVRIKCIGVWDTVGALGVPSDPLQLFNREHQFHDTELCELVECAFHAVAIDEKRGPFGPTLWQKRKGEPLKQKVVERHIAARVKPDPLAEIYESRSLLYTGSKLYPYQRLIGQNAVDGSVFRRLVARTNRPSDGCEFVNEMIHWSAIERFGKVARENGTERRYKPENLARAIDQLPISDERLQAPPARAA